MSATGSRRQTMDGSGSQSTAPPGAQAQPGFPPSLGYDPARPAGDRELTVAERIGKRVDLPIEAYTMVSSKPPGRR